MTCEARPAEPRRALVWTVVGLALLALYAVFLDRQLGDSYLTRQPDGSIRSSGISIYLYIRQDGVAAALGLLAVLALIVPGASLFARVPAFPVPRLSVAAMAAATLVLCVVGTVTVLHGHALSADEYMTRFQGAIFSAGRLFAPLRPDLLPVAETMQTFAFVDPANAVWASAYRPGMAMLHALFDLAGAGLFVSAALTAASIPLVAAIARRLWPGHAEAPVVGGLLMISSAQFLITGMTSYAMSAHLFFNLLWLWLFLLGGWRGHGAAGLVGVFAVGLHQVHAHPLFVLPFLLQLVWNRRWALSGFYLLVYSAAFVGWTFWLDLARLLAGMAAPPAVAPGEGGFFLHDMLRRLEVPSIGDGLVMAVNLGRFALWQNLALLPLAMAGGVGLWSRHPVLRALAWGVVLSTLPYLFVLPWQGHGWGYRYLHGLLGSCALLATAGWVRYGHLADMRRLLVAGTGLAVVMLGLRLVQVESFVRPYAEAARLLRQLDADIVVVDDALWYGGDLRQNPPFLDRRPVALAKVNADALRRLAEDHTVRVLTATDLAAAGIALPLSGTAPDPLVSRRE